MQNANESSKDTLKENYYYYYYYYYYTTTTATITTTLDRTFQRVNSLRCARMCRASAPRRAARDVTIAR